MHFVSAGPCAGTAARSYFNARMTLFSTNTIAVFPPRTMQMQLLLGSIDLLTGVIPLSRGLCVCLRDTVKYFDHSVFLKCSIVCKIPLRNVK